MSLLERLSFLAAGCLSLNFPKRNAGELPAPHYTPYHTEIGTEKHTNTHKNTRNIHTHTRGNTCNIHASYTQTVIKLCRREYRQTACPTIHSTHCIAHTGLPEMYTCMFYIYSSGCNFGMDPCMVLPCIVVGGTSKVACTLYYRVQ